MLKNIYLIRHCEAEGQSPGANLTNKGIEQAIKLDNFFFNTKIDRIISSPYQRAIQSIQPLAKRTKLEIEIESQLSERILSTKNIPDWLDKLKRTFEDPQLKFEGGESSQEAMGRSVEIVDQVFDEQYENTIIVTHGNLLALLLNKYDQNFGFEDWRSLSHPDIFLLKHERSEVSFERLWDSK